MANANMTGGLVGIWSVPEKKQSSYIMMPIYCPLFLSNSDSDPVKGNCFTKARLGLGLMRIYEPGTPCLGISSFCKSDRQGSVFLLFEELK